MSVFRAPPAIFQGEGVLGELGAHAAALELSRVLVVTTPGMRARQILQTLLASLDAAGVAWQIFSDVEPDPAIASANACADARADARADGVVGLGGGSALDVAKIAALLATHPKPIAAYFGVEKLERAPLPLLLAPTTAGTGSEVSPDAVLLDPERGTKRAVDDSRLVPSAAFVDPLATHTLPPRETAIAGIDALTHAVEAFVSRRASPLSDAMAREALDHLVPHLEAAVHGTGAARNTALGHLSLGSLYAGLAFGNAGTAAVHACAYPLSGLFGVPHGMANGLMLAPVTRFSRGGSAKYVELAARFGVPTDALADALGRLVAAAGLPTCMREVGVAETDVPRMAELVVPDQRHLSVHPCALGQAELEQIFREAL